MKKRYALGLYEKAMPAWLSWKERLEAVRACGFDHLEISIDETANRLGRLHWSLAQRAQLRRMTFLLETPIKTMCLSGHRKFPLGSHDKAIRQYAMEMMTGAIGLASDLGVRIIQLAGYDVYYEQSDPSTCGWFAENLVACVELASRAGILLGFETMETPFMDTVAKAMVHVSRIGSPYLGLYPDIGNLQNASRLYAINLQSDLTLGEGHIFATHLKETRPGVYRDTCFGEGHTAYEPCIQTLYQMGVRLFTAEFWHQGEPEYQKTLENASYFLREKIEATIEKAV